MIMEPVTINAFTSSLSMSPLTIIASPALSSIAVIMATLVLSALFAGILSLAHAVISGPAFEKKAKTFEVVTFQDRAMAVASKPAKEIVWEEPEAYFPIRRLPVRLGYKILS
jgi:hypothetical protein